jgi:hypothetical protein
MSPCPFFEEGFHPIMYPQKTRHVVGMGQIFVGNYNMESHRDQKRQSSKKHSDYAVYTKKAVRAKEAQMYINILGKKYGGANKSSQEPIQSCATKQK